jgi:hypothetical protein
MTLVANVAILAGIVYAHCSYIDPNSKLIDMAERPWHYPPPEGWPSTSPFTRFTSSFGYHRDVLLTQIPSAVKFYPGQVQVAVGWPLHVLLARDDLQASEIETRPQGILIQFSQNGRWAFLDLFQVGFRIQRPAHLPLTIHWPGMLATLSLWLSIWMSLLIVPGAIRRFIRRSRHGCESCGYSVATLATCPECGAQLAGVAA